MRVKANSAVNDGIIYYQEGKIVDGDGDYIKQPVSVLPSMPILDTSYYDKLMDIYDQLIGKVSSLKSDWQSGVIFLRGNTLEFRDFKTDKNLTITGYGRIIAKRDVYLHTRATQEV